MKHKLNQNRKKQISELSNLQMVPQSQKFNILPRVNKQFIGIGHQLQRKKQQRRKIQEQQKAITTRVSFLQKQQQKTRKQLQTKRKKFIKLMQTKERQQLQYQQKSQWRRSQQLQLQKLRTQNNYKKMLHRNNLNGALQNLHVRNHSDYARGKQKLKNDQASKRYKKYSDMQEKRDHMMSMSIAKQKGKIKVDKFFKTKNKEHLDQYKNRIKNQQDKTISKMNSIRTLEARQQSLKNKLQNSTLRASRMQQMITKISRTIQPSFYNYSHTKQRHHIIPDTNTTFHGSLTQRYSSGKAINISDSVDENIQNLNYQSRKMQKQFTTTRKIKFNHHNSNQFNQFQEA